MAHIAKDANKAREFHHRRQMVNFTKHLGYAVQGTTKDNQQGIVAWVELENGVRMPASVKTLRAGDPPSACLELLDRAPDDNRSLLDSTIGWTLNPSMLHRLVLFALEKDVHNTTYLFSTTDVRQTFTHHVRDGDWLREYGVVTNRRTYYGTKGNWYRSTFVPIPIPVLIDAIDKREFDTKPLTVVEAVECWLKTMPRNRSKASLRVLHRMGWRLPSPDKLEHANK